MAKKSEKNENRRESLGKAKEAPKAKAKEAPKKKAKDAQVDLKWERRIAILKEMYDRNDEAMHKYARDKNDRIMNVFLNIGYVFEPEEGKLIDYHLRNKIMDKPMDFCPIKEVDVYANHPRDLTEKSKVWYFFTRSRPNTLQQGTDVQGHWIFGEPKDIFHQDEKVGVKQVVEYCEGGHKSKYKIIEYQLVPAPENMKADQWFVCKLYSDGTCVNVPSRP